MTPRVADLGDMPALTAGFRPLTAAKPKPAPQPKPTPPTVPWPDTGPRTWPAAQTITVPTVPCCGKLRGDYCNCLDDLDQLLTAIREPIVFPAPLVDPALREVA